MQRSVESCSWSFNPRVLAGGRDDCEIAARAERTSFNPRVLAGGRDISQ